MKKKKLLIVVDYQNDFTVGSLGCPQAAAIEDTVAAKIEEYRAMGENAQIIFTMDTHDKDYLQTQEGRNLPIEHCQRVRRMAALRQSRSTEVGF